MFTNFEDFLNEWYTGPYAATGFKSSEPTERFTLNFTIKYDQNNIKTLKNILKKYDIPFDQMEITKDKDDDFDIQKINLTFKSYNNYEASSIVASIIKELQENQIMLDPTSISGGPKDNPERKLIGYGRKDKIENREGWYR
jgi:hypothetical protein